MRKSLYFAKEISMKKIVIIGMVVVSAVVLFVIAKLKFIKK